MIIHQEENKNTNKFEIYETNKIKIFYAFSKNYYDFYIDNKKMTNFEEILKSKKRNIIIKEKTDNEILFKKFSYLNKKRILNVK